MNEAEEKFIKQNVAKPVGNIWYWITCVHNGKTVICSCQPSESDAEAFIYQKNLESGVKIHALPTRDINAASRMIRGKKLDSGENLDNVMKRFKRKL